jgi:hypothetical protein
MEDRKYVYTHNNHFVYLPRNLQGFPVRRKRTANKICFITFYNIHSKHFLVKLVKLVKFTAEGDILGGGGCNSIWKQSHHCKSP